MTMDVLFNKLFPDGHAIACDEGLLTGFGTVAAGEVAVLGTTQHLAVGSEVAFKLAGFVLDIMKDRPGCPILMLVDTQGQRLSRTEELLGLNGFLAHLVKSLDLARRRGHRLLTLVYGEAVSGGFLSFGLMADEIHALDDARIRVMNLPAMARITKLPLEMLEALRAESPAFAPGVANFYKLGGIHSVWKDSLSEQLQAALNRRSDGDLRREDGAARQGRNMALAVSRKVSSSM